MPTSLYAHNEKLNTLVENDKSLRSLLLNALSEDNMNDMDKQLIVNVFSVVMKKDYDSTELIQSISTLLKCCDTISLEIQKSLEERLIMEKKEERRKILLLYPTPKQGSGKDKRYRCRPYVGGKDDKREVCKPTLKEAEDEIIRRHEEQTLKSMTLQEALNRYNDDRADICDSTKVHHEHDMKRFAKNLLNKPISEITAIEIRKEYVNAVLETEASKRACNNYKGILRRVFRHAEKHYGCNVIDINDCIEDLNTEINRQIFKKKDAPMLFEDPKDHYVKAEVIAFLNEASRRGTLKSLAAAETFFTGKRISEVCGMLKEDLDLDKRLITICHADLINKRTNKHYIGTPKGRKNRYVVIPECAVPYYRRILELSDPDSPYLFSDNSKRRKYDWIVSHKVEKEITEICSEIGIIRKSTHDMRRTYDSLLDDASMPSALRHLLMGHELYGIESSYLRDSHDIPEVQTVIDAAFEQFFGKEFKFEYDSATNLLQSATNQNCSVEQKSRKPRKINVC